MFTHNNWSTSDVTRLVSGNANLQSSLRDTSTHQGRPSDLCRQLATPWGFLLKREAQSNSFPQLWALNWVQLGRKSQDQDLCGSTSPLPGGKRTELSNSERKRLEVLCYRFGTGTSSATQETWSLVGKKEKQKEQELSLNIFFSLVPLQLLPLWAEPCKASCQTTAPALVAPLEGENFSSSLGWWSQPIQPPSPTQELWLIFAQGVMCWHDSHKQQTPLINVRSEHLCCCSVLHPVASTLHLLIWRLSQK